MGSRTAGFFSAILVGVGAAQTPGHSIEIKLPSSVASDRFFARYILTGQDFGGWVQPRAGVSSYVVDTAVHGRPATGIKAILYAPGCAIQTLDRQLSASASPPYLFVCTPVRSISIAGVVPRMDWVHGRDIELRARYVARPLIAGIVISIAVGEPAELSPDGHFEIVVPDLPQGEFQIWARDKNDHSIVARLVSTVSPTQSSEIVFAPRAATPGVHDRFGFARRPEAMTQ